MKKITITVSPKGQVKTEAFGFQGQECINATAPFTTATSRGPSLECFKQEFFQQEETRQELDQ